MLRSVLRYDGLVVCIISRWRERQIQRGLGRDGKNLMIARNDDIN